VESAKNSEYDFINLFVILIGTLAASGGFIAYAIQGTVGSGNSFDVFILGAAFALLTLFGWIMIYVVGGSLVKSNATWAQSAFSTVVPILALNSGNILADIKLSVFRLPSKMYASAALRGEPASVRDIVNGWLAPGGENIALLGFGAVITVVIYQKTGSKLLSIVPAATIGGIFFSYLHGLSGLGFKLIAFSIMFVSGLYLFGSDLGVYLPLKRYLLITFGFFYGIHRGINISNAGGLVEWYTTVLSAPRPILYVSQAIVVLDAAMYLLAGYYVVKKLAQGAAIGVNLVNEFV
jgi:hypothetical protein